MVPGEPCIEDDEVRLICGEAATGCRESTGVETVGGEEGGISFGDWLEGATAVVIVG